MSESAEAMLAQAKWRSVTWRSGPKGRLKARFAALRVRVADGPTRRIGGKANQHLPGTEEVWLVGEQRASGERKFYLSNLPPKASLRRLASAIKARWRCEQAHQQVKEELGLDHFEGRSWTGLHRHALMAMLAYAFLQHRRLAQAGRGKKAGACHRFGRPFRPCAGPSGTAWIDTSRDARIAIGFSTGHHRVECAKVALDALVNNAGISTGWGPPSGDTIASVRAIYDVNVFGAIRVTHAFLPLLRASEAPRIVMISSTLSSLAWASDFGAPMAHVNLLGYNSSKSALNAVTIAFAEELGPLGFKVDAGCPGYTATDLNQHSGTRTPRQGAAIGVRLATLPSDGPNGGFFDDDGVVSW